MNTKLKSLFNFAATIKATVLLLSVVFFFAATKEASAQRKFSKSYPASKNIRIQLTNRSGTIIVRGWDRKSVAISAWLEKPVAKIVPKNYSGKIFINVIRDNKGRRGVGTVNFLVYVPFNSKVDIETMVGNLEVKDINGGYVRAHISSEGDIRLLNVGAANVSAKNVIGDIFYDGLFRPEGTYRFVSTTGNINLRIPFRTSFKLVATAPSSRFIYLSAFKGKGLSYVGDGRRVVGKVLGGSANVTATTQRGKISFFPR